MLQQTQVDTVIPYYHRFLDRFPTVYDLANASQDDVLKAWEGLGYYARARNLHKAAHSIATDFGGTVPDTYDELKSLPGFGPYTTAAVLSIAYDRDHAVLDGNVIRVVTRLFDIGDDVTQTRVKNQLWNLAQALLPKGEAGYLQSGDYGTRRDGLYYQKSGVRSVSCAKILCGVQSGRSEASARQS